MLCGKITGKCQLSRNYFPDPPTLRAAVLSSPVTPPPPFSFRSQGARWRFQTSLLSGHQVLARDLSSPSLVPLQKKREEV